MTSQISFCAPLYFFKVILQFVERFIDGKYILLIKIHYLNQGF